MKLVRTFRTIAIGMGAAAILYVVGAIILILSFAILVWLFCGWVYFIWLPSTYNPNWKAEDFFNSPAEIALCEAINRSDITEIDKLIAEGVDVNKKGTGGMTFLLWAYPAGEASFTRILEHGGAPNVVYESNFGYEPGGGRGISQNHGETLIFFAMYSTGGAREHYPKFENYMQLLIDHGADINFHRRIGKDTPLHRAVFSQNRGAMRQLIEAGADLNALDEEGKTPMMKEPSAYDTVLFLLEAGADYRIIDKHNRTIAHYMARPLFPPSPQDRIYYDKIVKWLAERDISVERAGQQVDTWRQRREAVRDQYFDRRIPHEVIYGDDIPEGSQAPPPGPSTLTKERLDEYVANVP